MVTLFLEPGGDATGNANTPVSLSPGLWSSSNFGVPSVATDYVHGGHINSIKFAPNVTSDVEISSVVQAGSRVSFWIYVNAYPSASFDIFSLVGSGGIIFPVGMTTAGLLRSQYYGVNGSITLSLGTWYHITYAYTITSGTVNSLVVYVNGVSGLTLTNKNCTGQLPVTSWGIANGINSGIADTTLDLRISDIYADDSTALTDTGN